MEGKTKTVGAPEGNKNAEKYNFETSKAMLEKAVEKSKNEDYDFIGEVAKDIGTTNTKLLELVKKYPALNELYTEMKSNCEVNCFRNGKKGNINTAMSIMNLKSNHGWRDRIDQTSGDKPLEAQTTVIQYEELSDALIEEIAKKSVAWKK